MEIRDPISLIALAVSLVSLGISIWSSRFSKRTKLSEMRAAVLAKAAEASSRITHIYELELRMRLHAESLQDSQAVEHMNLADTDGVREQADRAYQSLSEVPPNQGLAIYENLFHVFQKLAEDSAWIERLTQANHDAYLATKCKNEMQWSDGSIQAVAPSSAGA